MEVGSGQLFLLLHLLDVIQPHYLIIVVEGDQLVLQGCLDGLKMCSSLERFPGYFLSNSPPKLGQPLLYILPHFHLKLVLHPSKLLLVLLEEGGQAERGGGKKLLALVVQYFVEG